MFLLYVLIGVGNHICSAMELKYPDKTTIKQEMENLIQLLKNDTSDIALFSLGALSRESQETPEYFTTLAKNFPNSTFTIYSIDVLKKFKTHDGNYFLDKKTNNCCENTGLMFTSFKYQIGIKQFQVKKDNNKFEITGVTGKYAKPYSPELTLNDKIRIILAALCSKNKKFQGNEYSAHLNS